MIKLLEHTRRPDISFYRNGTIRIAARVSRMLSLSPGDVINIAVTEGEYLFSLPSVIRIPITDMRRNAIVQNVVAKTTAQTPCGYVALFLRQQELSPNVSLIWQEKRLRETE